MIEAQLAHTVRDSVGRAYNRTEFVEQRREMLQTWADHLDQLRSGKDALRQRAGARHPLAPVSSSFYIDLLAEKQILALDLNNS